MKIWSFSTKAKYARLRTSVDPFGIATPSVRTRLRQKRLREVLFFLSRRDEVVASTLRDELISLTMRSNRSLTSCARQLMSKISSASAVAGGSQTRPTKSN